MPDDRHKTLHSAGGVVAEVSFVPAQGTGYTGIFQGAEFGIIRLSWMTKPAYDGHNIPGFAIKVTRLGTNPKISSSTVSEYPPPKKIAIFGGSSIFYNFIPVIMIQNVNLL